jgi:predicted P-loop ATPase
LGRKVYSNRPRLKPCSAFGSPISFLNEDASIALAGVWGIEIAELDARSRAEAGRVKAFFSRQIERFRKLYEGRPTNQDRQCVFIGTCNHEEFLKDETGNRRFWPVHCTNIDIVGLEKVRDQLWAKALHRFRAGEPHWMDTPRLVAAAAAQQDAAYDGGPWDEMIGDYLDGRMAIPPPSEGLPPQPPQRLDNVSVDEIFRHVLHVFDPAKRDRRAQMEIVRCLKHLGWEKRRPGDLMAASRSAIIAPTKTRISSSAQHDVLTI